MDLKRGQKSSKKGQEVYMMIIPSPPSSLLLGEANHDHDLHQHDHHSRGNDFLHPPSLLQPRRDQTPPFEAAGLKVNVAEAPSSFVDTTSLAQRPPRPPPHRIFSFRSRFFS